jgi:hypothetical protein
MAGEDGNSGGGGGGQEEVQIQIAGQFALGSTVRGERRGVPQFYFPVNFASDVWEFR